MRKNEKMYLLNEKSEFIKMRLRLSIWQTVQDSGLVSMEHRKPHTTERMIKRMSDKTVSVNGFC